MVMVKVLKMLHQSHFQLILSVLLSLSIFIPTNAGGQEAGEATQDVSKKEESRPVREPSSTETVKPQGKTRRSVKKDTEAILVEKGGILIPKGTLVIEPSLNYSHFSRNLIYVKGYSIFQAILIGKFRVEEVKRDILTAALTLRYGITDRLQFDLRIPYVYRRESLVIPASLAGEEEWVREIDDQGLGDIEGTVNIHAFRARGWLPDVTLNVKWKTRTGRDPFGLETERFAGKDVSKELPTGTGFYGLSGGFTLVKASDPVVFFGTLNYYWNIERDVGDDFGEVDPGNSIEYNLGMATALSEKVSFSFSFQNTFTSSTDINGEEICDSELNAATFLIGANYRLSPRTSLFTSLGIGLTEDSSDYQFQINIPISFSLF